MARSKTVLRQCAGCRRTVVGSGSRFRCARCGDVFQIANNGYALQHRIDGQPWWITAERDLRIEYHEWRIGCASKGGVVPGDNKLARIAAYQEYLGRTESQIEAYLHSVTSGLTEQQIQAAMVEGSIGRIMAQALTSGVVGPIESLLDQARASGASGYDILVHYQVNTGAGLEWKSYTFRASTLETPGSILDEIHRMAISSASKSADGSRPGVAVQSSIDVVFAVARY